MKELEQNLKERIEMSVKQKKEVKYELIDKIVPHEGHTIWKINVQTLEAEPVKFSSATYNMVGDNKKEVVTQVGYAYVAALNKKNAIRKYLKGKTGGKELGDMKLPY